MRNEYARADHKHDGTQRLDVSTAHLNESVGQSRGDTQFAHACVSHPIEHPGLIAADTQWPCARDAHSIAEVGHPVNDHQMANASTPPPLDELGHFRHDTQARFAQLVAQIRETHRMRQDLHRAEKSLTLQIKAIERRLSGATSVVPTINQLPRDLHGNDGPGNCDTQSDSADIAFFATLPLQESRAVVKKGRMKAERQLQKLAKQLPVWPWVEQVNGFGAMGLGQIVGEAGDLSLYANPAKLWKRMGLAVINGESQRRKAGAAALEHGYSPIRRSIMYCIGDSMIKKQNPYRELYLARKPFEESKVPDGTKMLWHRRAQRYMEKRLLRDLWRAWRDTTPGHGRPSEDKT